MQNSYTTPPQTPATATRRELMWVALALAGLAALALRPSIRGMDGVGNYACLASMLRGGDLDLRDEYALFDARRNYPFRFSELPVSPATGRPSDRYGVGSALLWAPFAAPVHLALRALRPELADGATRPYEWAVGLGTAFWGSLGLWLLYRRLRRDWGTLACGATLAALVLATPLGFYLYAHGSMSHGIGFFAATALALTFERAWRRPGPAPLAACGAALALLIITRFQDAPWALLAGGLLIYRVLTQPAAEATCSRRLAALSAALLGSALAALPQMAVWHALYGSWLSGPMPYLDSSAGTGSFNPWPTHALEALFSGRHGALAWHPAFAIGLAGLATLGWRRPEWRPWAALGLTGFAAVTWLVGCWSMWWAGASFGNRFFIGALPWLAPGLAMFFDGGGRRARRAAALALLGFLILWNFGLLVQYATEMIPREDPVAWGRIVKQNVIDVPRRVLMRR